MELEMKGKEEPETVYIKLFSKIFSIPEESNSLGDSIKS